MPHIFQSDTVWGPIHSNRLFYLCTFTLVQTTLWQDTSFKTGRLKNPPVVKIYVSISRSSRTVCRSPSSSAIIWERTRIHFPSHARIHPLRGVRWEPAASVDRRERRNWIVILFSKAICKCYQKFSGHACYSRFATRTTPANARQTPAVFSVGRFSFFRTENARIHDNDATSEFRIFQRISRRDERDERIRHGKLLSEIPTTTPFQPRVYWPLDLLDARALLFLHNFMRTNKSKIKKKYRVFAVKPNPFWLKNFCRENNRKLYFIN